VHWRDYFAAIGPPWTQRYWGERLWGAIAYMSDLVTEGMAQAVKAHLLEQETSPPDALSRIGSERQMPRYPSETNDQHRARLLDAWNAYEEGGTKASIIGQLATFGLSNVVVRTWREGWIFGDALGATHWSRFAVILETPHGITGPYTYGAGYIYGSPITYGSSATPNEVSTIKGIVKKWKAVHSENPWIYVVISGDYYGDPDLFYVPGGGGGATYGTGSIVKWQNDS
jgi:hypothetical protein